MNISQICPICKKHKKGVGPKAYSHDYLEDSRFIEKVLTLKTVVMCNDCLEKVKAGKIKITEKM